MTYQLMYETRNVRPYYTMAHLGIFGAALKKLTGFGYAKTIYVTSSDMNNQGFHDVDEMEQSKAHFAKVWKDNKKTGAIIAAIKQGFQEAEEAERWAWKQDWVAKTTEELLKDAEKMYLLLFKVFGTMIVSQPQHVAPLEAEMNKLLEPHKNKDDLLRAATYYPAPLPWAEEDARIKELHGKWKTLSKAEQDKALAQLVKDYGWFNTIEGDTPFDKEHYRKKIESYNEETSTPPEIVVPPDIRALGQLIAELGHLRFWNRHHFMSLRYHLKQILLELVKRSKLPELEYATVEEVIIFFKGEQVDLEEIRRRKNGYVSRLDNGMTKIMTGAEAEKYRKLVVMEIGEMNEVKGTVANKGKATGRVRIISFVAKDYNEQVAAFAKGEILVTGMTRPQIVHLCSKAAAIVTDEGGITSHAAVVSREYNVPCVIATKIATKVFKTGDLVEVDAETGVIRKVKKAS
jgi:phosphohistidine swiveling domain-containing protein